MIKNERLAQVFVELADTLVTDFDVTDFLQVMTDSTVEVMGAQGAGMMLADQRGALRAAAATGEIESLQFFEVEHDQGPCVDCFTSGRPVVNIDPDDARKQWPMFTIRAVEAGFRSVHAFPLRLRDEVIGAVSLYSSRPRTLDDVEVSVAQALADIATIGLLQERIIRDKTVLTEQLQSALNTRILIEQAKGIVAEQSGLSVAAAFNAIRNFARSDRRTIPGVAAAVIDGTLNAADWSPS